MKPKHTIGTSNVHSQCRIEVEGNEPRRIQLWGCFGFYKAMLEGSPYEPFDHQQAGRSNSVPLGRHWSA